MPYRLRQLAFGAFACVVLVAGPALAGDGGWWRYVNPRFGTADDIPVAGFVPDPPPDNGDGKAWTSVDGRGHIAVYGGYVVVADDFAGYREFLLETARNDGVDITYSAAKPGWFAYSGFKGETIVYAKVVVSDRCDTLTAHHLRITYPREQRAAYAPIVKHMAHSLAAVPRPCD